MKLFLKVIKITFLVIVVSLSVLFIAGWLLQDRITEYALDEIRTTLDTPLDIEKARFSLISDFPAASIKFDQFWIGAKKQNTEGIDTLTRVNSFLINVDTWDLLFSKITVKKIELDGGFAQYYVNENGETNFDFLLSGDSTTTEVEEPVESEPIELVVDQVVVTNLDLYYKDDQQQANAKITIPQINASLAMKDPELNALFNGNLTLSDVAYQDTPANRMARAEIDFDMDYRNDTLIVNSLKVMTEEASLEADGRIAIADSLASDLNIATEIPDLTALFKYLPDNLLAENKISQLAGGLKVQTKVIGKLASEELPSLNVSYQLDKATLRYDTLPLVYNVGINGSYTNGSKRDNSTTAITLQKFVADFDDMHFEIDGLFRNLDRLSYKTNTRFTIDLSRKRTWLPVSRFHLFGDQIEASIFTEGTVPDSINSKFVNELLQQSRADVKMKNLRLNVDSVDVITQFDGNLDYDHKYLEFKIKKMRIPDYKLMLRNNTVKMKMIGDVMNPDSLDLEIPGFRLAMSEGSIAGNATVKGLDKIKFYAVMKLDTELRNLRRYIPDSLVYDMSGKIQGRVRARSQITLDKITPQLIDVFYDKTRVELKLKNISLDMPDTVMNVEKLSGDIEMNSQFVRIKELKGSWHGMDFKVPSASIKNLFKTVMRNQRGTLAVDGDFQFGDLDYNILAGLAESEATYEATHPKDTLARKQVEQAWRYRIKGNLLINSLKYDSILAEKIKAGYNISKGKELIEGDISIGKLKYDIMEFSNMSADYKMNTRNFEVKGKAGIENMIYEDAPLSNISALYNINDSVYTIDKIRMAGFGGHVEAAMKIKLQGEDEMEIEMQSKVDSVDFRRMMKEMKNLYQDELTYENVSGELTTEKMSFRMKFKGDSILYPEMRMTADMMIRNGAIYHYAPVQDMAGFLPKIDNLDTLNFKTIESHLFIFKNAIYVPKTYVVTSAFDVETIGMQSFGEDYQYHVGVNLGQILGGKNLSSLQEGSDVDKKKMIYLKSTGRNGKYKNGFDKKDDREKIERKIKTQERLLNLTFEPKWFNFETNVEQTTEQDTDEDAGE